MKVKKIDPKKVAIFIAIIVIIVVIIGVIIAHSNSSENNNLELGDFERISIYNYLESDVLDISDLYLLSGNSNYDNLQIFQAKLKQTLDSYFSEHSESEVPTSTILELIDSKFVPENLDFHGVLVSNYEFNPENDSFVKSEGANAQMAEIEAGITNVDYSNRKVSIQNIEKTADNQYKVSFNIVNSMFEEETVEATGEAMLSINDNKINLDSCSINEQ